MIESSGGRRSALLAHATLTAAGEGVFSGYASLFGEVDLGRDVVVAGAFRRSLERRGAFGIRMLFQHDPAEPIGRWRTIREDERGLYVEGVLSPGVARARRPDPRHAAVAQRYRQLATEQPHRRPRRRLADLTSRARARSAPPDAGRHRPCLAGFARPED